MPTKAVEAGINDQIEREFYSAYLYLSMAAYFEEVSLPGFAYWMRVQYEEELSHALKLFDFMVQKGGHAVLHAIEKPPSGYDSPRAAMQQALAHERELTAAINKLYELSLGEKDYPAQLLLQWFISEQTEEEKTVADIIAQLDMVGDSGPATLMMDRQLAGRTKG